MNLVDVLFYVFAGMLIFSALRVVTTRNPVHAALWLVLAFFTAASVWMLLEAEFLAILLVVVYVGAVMVLFLFVVMMLDVNFEALRTNIRSYVPLALVVGALVLLEMVLVLAGVYFRPAVPGAGAAPPALEGSNTRELGLQVYTTYVYPFEIAAVILLVAIVAAIALTLQHRKLRKRQDPGAQAKVRRDERLRIVRMPAQKAGD
jgi:NADH-quinone oxidoreductase subunit J